MQCGEREKPYVVVYMKVTCPCCLRVRDVDRDYVKKNAKKYASRVVRCRDCGRKDRRGKSPALRKKLQFAAKMTTAVRVPPAPTDAEPGSPEKIKVLAKRFTSGKELHHPRDARLAPLYGLVAVMRARYAAMRPDAALRE